MKTPEQAREDCWCGRYRKPCEYHEGYEDGYEAGEERAKADSGGKTIV